VILPTFVDESAQRNIDVSQQKKVDGRLDDLQTNGLDGLRELPGSQVGRGRNDVHTRMDVHENRRGKGETQRGRFTGHYQRIDSKMSFNLQKYVEENKRRSIMEVVRIKLQ
jgi:hypothetical protein